MFQKELFMSTKECSAVSEKNKIDVFRILDNYPIRDSHLIITEKLSEHYSSFCKFLLGELRDHVRHNYFDVSQANKDHVGEGQSGKSKSKGHPEDDKSSDGLSVFDRFFKSGQMVHQV